MRLYRKVKMWMSIISTLLLLTTSTFVRSALAKNSTNDTTPSCDWSTKIDPKINSTGRYEFTWDSSYATNDPWYVSVLVIAPVQGQSTEVGARAYISVPKNVSSDTRLCMYQFVNINATLEAGGRNSCNGAISATCIEYLTDALDKTETIYCPNYFAQSDEFAKACPMLAEGSSIRSMPSLSRSFCFCAVHASHKSEEFQSAISPCCVRPKLMILHRYRIHRRD